MEKIISVGRDELSEYDFERLEKLGFDLMVYGYEDGGYDGSGFAAFKKGDQWFYQELGHCSCYGPLENVETSANMLVSLDQVIALAENSYSDVSKEVARYIKRFLPGYKSDTSRLIGLLEDEDFRGNFTGQKLIDYIDSKYEIKKKDI